MAETFVFHRTTSPAPMGARPTHRPHSPSHPNGGARRRSAPRPLFTHEKCLQRLIHILFPLDGHRDKALMRDRAQLFVQRAPTRLVRLPPAVEGRRVVVANL